MNRVTLLGNVGNAEFHTSEKSGGGILKFSVATNKKWKNDAGETVEDVQWHRCVMFGKRADALQEFVTKGSKVAIEGELRYGKYEKEGVVHYTTDVVVNNLEFCGGKRGSSDTSDAPAAPPAGDDEIPF